HPTSRIDLLWYPDDLIPEYCFNQVWQPPCTLLATTTTFNLDHRCLIVYFSKALFIGDLPLHRRRQKGEWRSFYDVSHTTDVQWSNFATALPKLSFHHDSNLDDIQLDSALSFHNCLLDSRWQSFIKAVHTAARAHLPVKKVPPSDFNKSFEDERLIYLK